MLLVGLIAVVWSLEAISHPSCLAKPLFAFLFGIVISTCFFTIRLRRCSGPEWAHTTERMSFLVVFEDRRVKRGTVRKCFEERFHCTRMQKLESVRQGQLMVCNVTESTHENLDSQEAARAQRGQTRPHLPLRLLLEGLGWCPVDSRGMQDPPTDGKRSLRREETRAASSKRHEGRASDSPG